MYNYFTSYVTTWIDENRSVVVMIFQKKSKFFFLKSY